jgi:hypothetical protein
MNAKVLALYPALMLLATPATAGVTFTYTGYVVAGYDETLTDPLIFRRPRKFVRVRYFA